MSDTDRPAASVDYQIGKEVDILRENVELEGYTPGTPQFERVFLARRVTKCQELRGVFSCPNCPAFDDCPLAKAHMLNLKYGDPGK